MSDTVSPSSDHGIWVSGVTGQRPCTWLHDPVVRMALHQWARHPWEKSHGMVLADRLEEILLPVHASWVRITLEGYGAEMGSNWNLVQVQSRKSRRKVIKWWTAVLKEEFGDFDNHDTNTLPVRTPADTIDTGNT